MILDKTNEYGINWALDILARRQTPLKGFRQPTQVEVEKALDIVKKEAVAEKQEPKTQFGKLKNLFRKIHG